MYKFECTVTSDSVCQVYIVYARAQETAEKKAVQMFEDDFPELFHVDHVTAVRV